MMPGNHFEWAVSWSFGDYLSKLKSTGELNEEQPIYHVYCYVRCDAKVDDGLAMTIGIYDPLEEKGVVHRALSVEDIKGQNYVCVDLGSLPLRTSQYLWFAPPKRPDDVQAVYIDRAVIVREH